MNRIDPDFWKRVPALHSPDDTPASAMVGTATRLAMRLTEAEQEIERLKGENRKLDAECDRLAGQKLRLEKNNLELAHQLDQQRACYWQAADEHRREVERLQAELDALRGKADDTENKSLVGLMGALLLAGCVAAKLWGGM